MEKLALKKSDKFQGRKGPLLLIIMDGIGFGQENETNAVYLANTPTLDRLFKSERCVPIAAHGVVVGLPSDEDMGNSEVGHNALGAGRIIAQGARRVNEAFERGDIFKGKLWKEAVERGKKGGAVHFIGLLSDGNVHSNVAHVYKMLDKLVELGLGKVRVHPLLDGRDVPPRSALEYVIPLEKYLKKVRDEKGYDYIIASGGGRMNVTMDRYEADWEIVKRGWDAHVNGIGRHFRSFEEAVTTYYEEGKDDQYMGSIVIVDENYQPVGRMENGDAAILFNFRGDRAIELSMAFEGGAEFDKFNRGRIPDVLFAGMMEYDSEAKIPKNFIVEPPTIHKTVSQYFAAQGIKMFAISETQKFGHVTYFWNGNRSGYIDKNLETYIEIPSDKIEFDQAPKMKAIEITDKTIELLRSGEYVFGRLNFANGDMVGHTGVMKAAIEAVETVDLCIDRLLKTVEQLGGIAIVTADHGNSDEMFTMKGDKKLLKTAHTLNAVPFVIVDSQYHGEYKMAKLERAGLNNVAATLCNLLGYEKPEDYDPSLIEL
jgi:2,3-bisphosphoglycerate-independent phosphoglycerate mutase